MSKAMTEERRKWKKAALSALVGTAVGAGSVSLAIWLAGDGLLDAMGPSRIILASVGLIYVLIAAMIGFGLAAPRAGAKMLNVGDAEELVDDRSKLLRSTLYMLALGLALALLAVARAPGFSEGLVSPGVGLAAILILLIASATSFLWMGPFDELDRQIGIEGGSWAFLLACCVLVPWASLDALGWAVPLASIHVVTVLAVSLIAGSFVAVGKRGMMVR